MIQRIYHGSSFLEEINFNFIVYINEIVHLALYIIKKSSVNTMLNDDTRLILAYTLNKILQLNKF